MRTMLAAVVALMLSVGSAADTQRLLRVGYSTKVPCFLMAWRRQCWYSV